MHILVEDEEMTSFTEIYRRYAKDIYRFAYWLSRNEEEAKDVVAETFIRAWAGSGDLRLDTVKAYLLAIARNLVLENKRKRRPDAELDQQLPDSRPGPERAMSARSELALVRLAMKALPEPDRTALLMRVQDGASYKDISRTLSISVSAAKVKVHRARLRLAAAKEKTP